MHDAPLFLFITIQICSLSLSCDLLKISLIYVFPASKNSSCKLIKQSNQPVHTLFCQFCTHLFYIEGNGQEGKVHEDLVLSKMSETFVVHIVFNLSEHGFRFYASLPSVFQSFLRAEQFFGSPLVLSKPMIQFYRPVSFCFKTAASQGIAFTPDSSVPCIFVDISGCGFHIPGAYPPHPLPHRADAEVMFFIVVEVFGLERVRFESRPLLHVEIVVLYVGFHAVFGHEAVILFGAIAGISNHRMGHPVIPV